MFRFTVIALTLCLSAVTAQAALLGRAALTPGGSDYQGYYDDVLNITWMADANLAASNSFGVTGICTTALSFCDGAGTMSWITAQSWIGAMNTAAYLGTNDWRLPTVKDTGALGCVIYAFNGTNCGYNVSLSTSEMAHMFHSTLGNLAYYNSSGSGTHLGWGLTNTGPFSNLQPYFYWSGTEYAPDPNDAWDFTFYDGAQGYSSKAILAYAWAVTDGDALATVPVPAAFWLFGSALALMGVMRRKISS
jgi:hypothetical protein